MARPNNATAIAGRIQGLREAKAAFQALPDIVREEMNAATELTLSEIVRHAKAQVMASPSIRTRALLNSIAWTINRKSGHGKAGVTSGTTTGYFAAGTGVAGELRKRTIKGVLIAGRGGSALTAMGARLIKPSRYAHLVEFGARQMKAEPFMRPAVESQQLPHIDRCKAAGRRIEPRVAAIGARTL